MSKSLLAELTVLFQETELLLACPEPDTIRLERYGQWRWEIFSRLQNMKDGDAQGEVASLRTVLTRIQEQDRLLLQQLETQRIRCREELLTVAKARQAMKDDTPSFAGQLLERRL